MRPSDGRTRGRDATFNLAQLGGARGQDAHTGRRHGDRHATVSNKGADGGAGTPWLMAVRGYSCIAENPHESRRSANGAPKTPFMQPGDTVRIEMRDHGQPLDLRCNRAGGGGGLSRRQGAHQGALWPSSGLCALRLSNSLTNLVVHSRGCSARRRGTAMMTSRSRSVLRELPVIDRDLRRRHIRPAAPRPPRRGIGCKLNTASSSK